MEKWPAQIGALYYDVTTSIEKLSTQIVTLYIDVTT